MARIAVHLLVLACVVSASFASEKLPGLGASQKEIEELLGKPHQPAGKMIFGDNPNVRELLYLKANPPRIYTMQEGYCVGIRYFGSENLGVSREDAAALLKIHAAGNDVAANGENEWLCPNMRWFARYDTRESRLYISRWR